MADWTLTWSRNSVPPAIFRFREYVLLWDYTRDLSH